MLLGETLPGKRLCAPTGSRHGQGGCAIKLTMLGTGHAYVTECYNTCFVLENAGKYLLVDGGGGNTILRQLKLAGYNWMDIREIVVTHKHMDHLLGVLWLIRLICDAMAKEEYAGEASVYAHNEVLSLLRELAEKLLNQRESRFVGNRLRLIELHNGETLQLIGRPVTFFDIRSTKAKQYGFSMEMGNGEKLTCCGDEPLSDDARAYAQGSKWLLHEAFCLSSQAELFEPYQMHHSTVKDACRQAELLCVKNLLLYHTEDLNLEKRKALYREEGSRWFHGGLFIPDDLETIEL